MIKSVTAVKRGWGSMPHRWVSFLTTEERTTVKNGGGVYFEINKTHYTQSGFKIVTHTAPYGWDCREPNQVERAEIEKLETKLAETPSK